ncbi:trigger factor [Pantanalinema rosaneae CENA516]|uniref:trigger factor n=1 Tax=Pantanalinema rosaneae TaxID=1620701 RepID=UPI003D6F7419
MKVTQEKLPASQLGLEIEITPEMSKKAYEQVIQKLTRSANIPGFRKGKVPRQVLIQRFGSNYIKATVVEELIDSSLKAAIQQEKIDALGNFQLRSTFEELVQQFDPGQALTFSASVDVPPEVTLKQYANLSVQAEEVKPDPERVDKLLEQYREQMATLVPVEGRSAQMQDVAVIDFKGALPGEDPDAEPEEFPGGQAQDFQVELAESRFIPGFVEGIVGMNPGDIKELQLQFPEEYPQEDLAGKNVIFTITLKELKEKELPELDDDFAQDASKDEYQTLAELREALETRFNKEAEDKTKANQEQAILNELLKHIEVELPETLVDRELTYILNQTAMQLQNQGIDIKQLFNQNTIPMFKERSRPDAIDRIKRTLALGEVAKQESIQVTPEEVSAKITELLEEVSEQERRNLDEERLHTVIEDDLLREKVVNWLIEHTNIELVPEGSLAQPTEEAEDLEAAELEEVSEAESSIDTATETTITVEATEVVEPEAAEETGTAESPTTKSKSKAKKTSASPEPAAEAPESSEATASGKATKSRKTSKTKSSSASDE